MNVKLVYANIYVKTSPVAMTVAVKMVTEFQIQIPETVMVGTSRYYLVQLIAS